MDLVDPGLLLLLTNLDTAIVQVWKASCIIWEESGASRVKDAVACIQEAWKVGFLKAWMEDS